MIGALRGRIAKAVLRVARPDAGTVTLTQRRIYILPTASGLLFAATLLAMLIGCMNYNVSLGYVLTFLVSSIGVVSILHTFRNLAQLQLRAGRSVAVFAGEHAVFPILLVNPTRLSRKSLALQARVGDAVYADVAEGQTVYAALRIPSERRGILHIGRIRVFTLFPLGLTRAWSNVELDATCVVYPAPESGVVPLPTPSGGTADGAYSAQGSDDFAGLRKYELGDSLRHVAWKALARGQVMLTKQFSGMAAGTLWLEWDAIPADMPHEARISRVARWVLDASHSGQTFGLRLPADVLAPAAGAAHEEQCLTALALLEL
ncbi:MAG: DUF58 domain-containing protein [Betaproteobacteria bacterium]